MTYNRKGVRNKRARQQIDDNGDLVFTRSFMDEADLDDPHFRKHKMYCFLDQAYEVIELNGDEYADYALQLIINNYAF